MQREEALGFATGVAETIHSEVKRLAGLPVQDLRPLAKYSLRPKTDTQIQKKMSVLKIHDIFIFGSTAEGKRNPNDVDMMVIDSGLLFEFVGQAKALEIGASHNFNGCNFDELLCVLFNLGDRDHQKYSHLVRRWYKSQLDFFILPHHFFKDAQWRITQSKKQPENFFKNAFRSLIRYDGGIWTPFTIRELEQRYRASLSDLAY